MSANSELSLSDADPVTILQNLIRCPSVTPLDAGALDYLQAWLSKRGFECHRLPYGQGTSTPSDNLFARLGTSSPHFCFAGHTDVVPPGNEEDWKHPPFSAAQDAGKIWGRGAVDMKGGVAAFMAATDALLAKGELQGSISYLITGDEEGPAVHGTKAVVEWMQANDQIPDACLVGEPTNPSQLTDMSLKSSPANCELCLSAGTLGMSFLPWNPSSQSSKKDSHTCGVQNPLVAA